MPPRKKQSAVSTSPFELKLQEAEDLQQRAERRGGTDAFKNAAQAFRQALDLAAISSPSLPRLLDCKFGLAETLQHWAETLISVVNSLPDDQLTVDLEHSAASQACELFQQSAHMYQQVHNNDINSSILRVDAAVNIANTYSSWAEIVSSTARPTTPQTTTNSNTTVQKLHLLQESEKYYMMALNQEEDAVTFSNLADVYVQSGELLCQIGLGGQGQQNFQKSQEMYSKACELSSSETGDDLPGLLLNWGAGVLAAAGHANDPVVALTLIEEAITRLRESISFDRGDPMPYNALGEALVSKAEWLMRKDEKNEANQEALQALHAALDEAYGGALKINSTQADALVGAAEACVSLAKLYATLNNATLESQYWHKAVEAYSRALQTPTKLGNLSERSDIRYNYACCLVKCDRIEEATSILNALIQAGLVQMADIEHDADLAVLTFKKCIF